MSEAYEIFQKRITSQRSVNKQKLIEEKERDFIIALDKSYNSEEIEINGVRTKGIINRVEATPQLRTKNFSALNKYCSVGDIFKWVRDNSYWMITERNENEFAYFNGVIKEAPYFVTWRDPITGISYSSRAAVKGPEETSLKVISKSGLTVHEGNLSLMFSLPKKAEGIEILKRYSEVFVDGEKWEVVATDKYTDKYLISFDLVEAPIDRDGDDVVNSIPGGKDEVVFTHTTALSGISEAALGFNVIDLSPALYRNGVPYEGLDETVRFVNCTKIGDGVLLSFYGEAKVIYTYPSIGQTFTHSVQIVSSDPVSPKLFYIEGPDKVGSYLSASFEVHLKESGLIIPTTGTWAFDEQYFSLISSDVSNLVLKAKGTTGVSTIQYTHEGEICSKDIKIVPIFEI